MKRFKGDLEKTWIDWIGHSSTPSRSGRLRASTGIALQQWGGQNWPRSLRTSKRDAKRCEEGHALHMRFWWHRGALLLLILALTIHRGAFETVCYTYWRFIEAPCQKTYMTYSFLIWFSSLALVFPEETLILPLRICKKSFLLQYWTVTFDFATIETQMQNMWQVCCISFSTTTCTARAITGALGQLLRKKWICLDKKKLEPQPRWITSSITWCLSDVSPMSLLIPSS